MSLINNAAMVERPILCKNHLLPYWYRCWDGLLEQNHSYQADRSTCEREVEACTGKQSATTILMTFNITAYLSAKLYSATTATKLVIPNLIPGMAPGIWYNSFDVWQKISASEKLRKPVQMRQFTAAAASPPWKLRLILAPRLSHTYSPFPLIETTTLLGRRIIPDA